MKMIMIIMTMVNMMMMIMMMVVVVVVVELRGVNTEVVYGDPPACTWLATPLCCISNEVILTQTTVLVFVVGMITMGERRCDLASLHKTSSRSASRC